MQEGRLPVAGGELWYGIAGAGRPGVPLLVLHGGPGVPHDYLEPLAALAADRPVVFYDQLGCGRSSRPEEPFPWSLGRFVAELGAVRRGLGLAEIHLLGQSWGTMLAVDYLLRDGTAGVRSLVLSSPCLSAAQWAADARALVAALPDADRAAIARANATGDFAAPAFAAAMETYYRRHVCRREPWPDCLNRAIAGMSLPVYQAMWGPSEFLIRGSLRGYERVDRLAEVAVPTLFTCGRWDEATPTATARYAQALPGAELVVFEDAAHEHHLEQPETYLAVVGDFLRRASG